VAQCADPGKQKGPINRMVDGVRWGFMAEWDYWKKFILCLYAQQ
jgi:hypothetical protein